MTADFGRTARALAALAALLAALTGCGGGSSPSSPAPSVNATASVATQAADPGSNLSAFANEGLNWFNVRRQQIGLAAVTRNTVIDNAALGHSNYQKLNNTITHDQTPGQSGFTGTLLRDRLDAAGYVFRQGSYSFGEVISATTDGSGVQAAENLIGAIYHRYVIFEPMFREAGAGAAMVPDGYTFFTVNFAADGLRGGLGRGKLVTYPYANQQEVDTTVFSDRETPDPIPETDEVGYPISVHADVIHDVTVQSFTVRPRGGSPLPVRLQTSQADVETPPSAAAIIPLSPLSAGTTYDVQFSGTAGGLPVTLAWSFRTR
jgi:uncharacterized protein YkwD